MWTEDMDLSLLAYAQGHQAELDADRLSPSFWKSAQTVLKLNCTWKDAMMRYQWLTMSRDAGHEVSLRVILERISSSDGSLVDVLNDVDEEDYQSGSSEAGEDEYDDDELARASLASQDSLMKMLSASVSKPRVASRRLAEKQVRGMEQPQPSMGSPSELQVRKNLQFANGMVEANGADHALSGRKRTGSGGKLGSLNARDAVSMLADEVGVSHKIAMHALIVNGGSMSGARRYLNGVDTRHWTVEEDNLIRDALTPQMAEESVRKLMQMRSKSEIIHRCRWMISQGLVSEGGRISPRGGSRETPPGERLFDEVDF